MRDSLAAAAEMEEREEEKSEILGRDLLGLRGADFDLRTLETNQVDILNKPCLITFTSSLPSTSIHFHEANF